MEFAQAVQFNTLDIGLEVRGSVMNTALPMPEPEGRPDRVLLALTRAGDRGAAGELYERYARRLWALAARRTAGGPLDPDDVVQSAFRTFLAGVKRGRYDVPEGRDLWALLVAVALNKVRAYRREAGALKRGGGRRFSADADPIAPDADPTLEVAARDILGLFSPRERELIELRLAGHRVDAIAARVARSKRTIERTLQTCRDRLLQLMADHD